MKKKKEVQKTRAGFELTTDRTGADCSTAELTRLFAFALQQRKRSEPTNQPTQSRYNATILIGLFFKKKKARWENRTPFTCKSALLLLLSSPLQSDALPTELFPHTK